MAAGGIHRHGHSFLERNYLTYQTFTQRKPAGFVLHRRFVMAKITVSTMALMAALCLPAAAIAQTNDNQQQVPQDQTNEQTQAVQKTEKVNIKGLIMLQDQNTFL